MQKTILIIKIRLGNIEMSEENLFMNTFLVSAVVNVDIIKVYFHYSFITYEISCTTYLKCLVYDKA